MKWFEHLKTVHHHRALVRSHCFKLGLYWQGLTHDLSKYSPTEFQAGARYWKGTESPNNGERKANGGISYAWLHHKGRNKHHMEYWIDYGLEGDHRMTGLKMPRRYVAEMFCDRVAASKTYRGDAYQDSDPYAYFLRSRGHYLIHPETEKLLGGLLKMLQDRGEAETFAFIREKVLRKKDLCLFDRVLGKLAGR